MVPAWGLEAGLAGTRLTGPLVLVSFLALPLAVRSRSDVLQHPTRLRIYGHLLLLPGDHFRSILRALGLSTGEGRHHLNVLLRSGIVREEKAGGRCRYYAVGQGPTADRNVLFAKHWGYRDMRLRVLFAVKAAGAVTPTSVANAVGISRQLAAYHLAALVEIGHVRREGRVYRVS